MKKLTFLFLFLPLVAFGQSFQGHCRAFLSKGISITEASWLDFSNIAVTGEGTLTVATDASTVLTGSIASRGVASPCVLSVSAMPNCYITVSLPQTASMTNGSTTLYVSSFTSNLTNGMIKTDPNGACSIIVGGKLSIPAIANFGEYSGIFNVTLNYQ